MTRRIDVTDEGSFRQHLKLLVSIFAPQNSTRYRVCLKRRPHNHRVRSLFLKVPVSKDHKSQRTQLAEQRRKVDFDTYDITIDELIRRVAKSRIDVAPAYQRQFRWDDSRQSALVESLFLGIPVPPLFMATNGNAGEELQWEVVDGLQRLLTLVNFIADEPVRGKVRLDGKSLALKDLENYLASMVTHSLHFLRIFARILRIDLLRSSFSTIRVISPSDTISLSASTQEGSRLPIRRYGNAFSVVH